MVNTVDMATRGKAKVADLVEDLEWQRGPKFFRMSRDSWPTITVNNSCIPQSELRRRQELLCYSLSASSGAGKTRLHKAIGGSGIQQVTQLGWDAGSDSNGQKDVELV